MFAKLTLISAVIAVAASQYPSTTPVPILKQINKQNDDGSYSYGYEAADGSFKIETKYPNGDVAGKYGYVDESGKTREISYGASKQRGFEPQGTDIMVPPPTLHNPPSNALTDGQEDDGQYREDPAIYEDPKYNSKNQRVKAGPSQTFSFQQPQFKSQNQISEPVFQNTYQNQHYNSPPAENNLFRQSPQQFPDLRSRSQVYHQQPQFSFESFTPQTYQQSYQPQQQSYQPQQQNYQPQQQSYQPQVQSYQHQNYQVANPHQNFNPFFGHPAQNFDPNTGSYTINFTG